MSGDIWKMLSEIPQEEHEEGSGVAPVAKQWQPLRRIITDAAGSAGVGDGRNMRGAVEPLKKKLACLRSDWTVTGSITLPPGAENASIIRISRRQ